MAEENYTVKEMITEFRRDVEESFKGVEKKLDYTNGTVKEHTIQLAMMKGAIGILVLIVIPLLVYVWNQAAQQREDLQVLINKQ